MHSKQSENIMKGLLLAHRQGLDMEIATKSFWVPMLCQKGMLISVNKQFYICLGPTPAVLPLQEIGFAFNGPLPAEDLDESQVPIDSGKTQPVQTLLLKLSVRCFKYSLHVAVGSWTEELDCNVLLRRAMQSVPLIVRLVETGEVIKLTAECLSQALEAYGANVRKNTTKTQKIRAICKLGIVQQHVSQACVETVLQTCQDLDEKRRKRTGSKSQQEDDGNSDEDELDEVQDLLIERDPAWAAAEDLLDKLEQTHEEKQRDADQTSGAEMPVEASAATSSEDPGAGMAAAREEKSRRLLVTTRTIPQFLKERFAALENVAMTHQVTKDKTLPHFQARLLSGTHAGKILGITLEASLSRGRVYCAPKQSTRGSCAASYNPDIQSREINESIKRGAQLPPKERSQAQAYYICWCWGKEADDALNSAKRRRVA
ncbi:unnamed protein product [Symbiodinium sp. CCMP2456]|nr:unnamed protein product [Symbiodinium sp. CCMP2456]